MATHRNRSQAPTQNKSLKKFVHTNKIIAFHAGNMVSINKFLKYVQSYNGPYEPVKDELIGICKMTIGAYKITAAKAAKCWNPVQHKNFSDHYKKEGWTSLKRGFRQAGPGILISGYLSLCVYLLWICPNPKETH